MIKKIETIEKFAFTLNHQRSNSETMIEDGFDGLIRIELVQATSDHQRPSDSDSVISRRMRRRSCSTSLASPPKGFPEEIVSVTGIRRIEVRSGSAITIIIGAVMIIRWVIMVIRVAVFVIKTAAVVVVVVVTTKNTT